MQALLAVALLAALAAARDPSPRPVPQDAAAPKKEPTKLLVWMSSEKEEWIAAAIRRWSEVFPDRKIEPVPMGSFAIQRGLVRGAKGSGSLPHVAIPASRLQLRAAEAEGVRFAQEPVTIARTFLVIAAWKDVAEKLGWPDKPVSVADLVRPAREGKLRLGHCHPDFSNSGALAMLLKARALQGDAARGGGEGSAPAPASFTASELATARETWLALEGAQASYGSSTGFYKDLMISRPDAIDAAFVYENLVIEAAKEQSPKRLVAIYPAGGTYMMDCPYAIVGGKHQSEETVGTARLFLQYLLTEEQQQIAMDRGFRRADRKAKSSPVVFKPEHGVRMEEPDLLPDPAPKEVASVASWWRANVKKKAQVTLALDVSRSMDGQRIESLKRAAKGLVQDLADTERIAVFTFTRDVTLMQEMEDVGKCRDKLVSAIDAIKTAGGTYLVEATRTAVEYAQKRIDASRTSIVVVMTDGKDPRYRLHEPAFLEQEKAIRAAKDVVVFTIGIGDEGEVDDAMLKRLASAPTGFTRGTGQDIESIFAEQVRSQF